MTKQEFAKKKWGYGMEVLYKDGRISIISPVVSVDFENSTIGIDLPNGDLFYVACEKCEITKDFVPAVPHLSE